MEMRTDVELLNALCNEAPLVMEASGLAFPLSKKRIAHVTGMSVQTVSDYGSGHYNIPIEFWRRLLSYCCDPRIIALLLGDDGRFEVVVHNRLPESEGRDFFKQAVADEGDHYQKMMYVAEMLADGRIDELDRASVQSYHDAYLRHRMTDAALHHAIMRQYRKAQVKESLR